MHVPLIGRLVLSWVAKRAPPDDHDHDTLLRRRPSRAPSLNGVYTTDRRQICPTIARLSSVAAAGTVHVGSRAPRNVCVGDQLYDLGQGTRISANGTDTP